MGIAEYTSKGLEKFANLVTSVSEVLPNADPTPSTLAIDPGERAQDTGQKLLDLKIPKALAAWLPLPLASLGFSIEPIEVPGNKYTPSRSYSVIKNAAGQHSMFHIPMAILKDGSNWEAVGSIISSMGQRLKKQVLIVVSENLDVPSVAYSALGRPMWLAAWEVKWTFVPWGELQQIGPLPESDQLTFLPQTLQLEGLLEEARKLPASTKITIAEIATLAEILARLAQFTDSGGQAWRLLLDQAGLKEFTGSLQLGETPKIVAFSLLDRLKDIAPVVAFPQDQVLGLLLCEVLKIGDLPPADSVCIKDIMKKYNLAPTRTY